MTAIKQMLSIIFMLRNKILNTLIFIVFILPLFSILYNDREQGPVNRMLLTGYSSFGVTQPLYRENGRGEGHVITRKELILGNKAS